MQVLISLLAVAQNHFSDVALFAALAVIAYFQFKSSKHAKNTQNSCDRIEEKTKTTIPSVSKRMIEIVKNSASINRELDRIVGCLKADRGWVYIFHNSGYDFLGQPFAKVTNTNESISPAVCSKISEMKDIPVGMMACFVEDLLKNKEVRCSDIEKYKDHDRTAYSYLRSLNIKSTYAVALFAPRPEHVVDKSNETRSSMGSVPLGFVGVDFIRNTTKLDDDDFDRLHDAAMIIKGLLIERQHNEFQDEQKK